MDVDGATPIWMRRDATNAARTLHVSRKTLRQWADIRSIILPSPGIRRHRLFDVSSTTPAGRATARQSAENDDRSTETAPADAIYARVSTRKQQEHLNRQVAALRAAHPGVRRVFTDVCSGINFQRRGLAALLDLAFADRLRTVHVAHRDGLCRFAFDLIEDVLRRCGVHVQVESHDAATSTPEGELAVDMHRISIVTVFAARVFGARSSGRRRRSHRPSLNSERDPTATNKTTTDDSGQLDDDDAQLSRADASDGRTEDSTTALV
jgi:predicted site-specific integrase-resolvase